MFGGEVQRILKLWKLNFVFRGTPDYRDFRTVVDRRNVGVGHWQNGSDEKGLKNSLPFCLPKTPIPCSYLGSNAKVCGGPFHRLRSIKFPLPQ